MVASSQDDIPPQLYTRFTFLREYACVRACVCGGGVGARAWACACIRVALSSMQRAAILSSAASWAPPYFLTSEKQRDFRKKKNY